MPDAPGNTVVVQGGTGPSAYQLAVKNGFKGTEQAWLDSLKGESGNRGIALVNRGDWLGGTLYNPNDYVFSTSSTGVGESAWLLTDIFPYASLISPKDDAAHWFEMLASPGTPYLPSSRRVDTQYSLTGGGDLTVDRTLNLVGDTASPGNNKVYGTDGAGVRGWFSSSGLVIKEAGTPMTSRAGLNFNAGFDLADDAGNNETDINLDLSEVATGGDLTWVTNTPTIAAGAVTLAKMANMATDSILGRATAGTGAPEVLTALPFALTGGDVTAPADSNVLTIANDAVTLAKMANMATDSILGRATAGTGDPEVLAALPFALTGGDVTSPADSSVLTIGSNAVTYAKMQDISAAVRLLGRGSGAGAGDPEEIVLGTNLSMSGATLNVGGGPFGGSYTTHGDSAYSILSTDRLVVTSAALTAIRAWTLPLANSVSAGTKISIVDMFGGMSSTNYINAGTSGSDKFWPINNAVVSLPRNAYGALSFISDGSSKWYTSDYEPGDTPTNGYFLYFNAAWSRSPYTLPGSAGTAGLFLRSDGSNITNSGWTIPNNPPAAGRLMQASSINSAVWSTPTWPTSAATTGNVVTADGTNFVSSPLPSPGGASITLHGDSNYSILSTDRIVATSATLTANRTWTLPAANTVSAGTGISIIDLAQAIGAQFIIIGKQVSDTLTPVTSPAMRSTGGGWTFISDGVTKWQMLNFLPGGGGSSGFFPQIRAANEGIVMSAWTLPTALGTNGSFLQQTSSTVVANSAYTLPTAVPTLRYSLMSDGTNLISYPTGAGLVQSAVTGVASAYAADTYLAGSNVQVAAGDWKVKGQYHCVFDMVKTAAGTASFTVIVRMGTIGSTSDAAIATLTFDAGTAAADTGIFEIWVTFRTVGSGTSAVIQVVGECRHQLAATGLVSTGAAGVGIKTVTSAGFNSTTQTIIGLSINGGTSFSGTNSFVQAQLNQP